MAACVAAASAAPGAPSRTPSTHWRLPRQRSGRSCWRAAWRCRRPVVRPARTPELQSAPCCPCLPNWWRSSVRRSLRRSPARLSSGVRLWPSAPSGQNATDRCASMKAAAQMKACVVMQCKALALSTCGTPSRISSDRHESWHHALPPAHCKASRVHLNCCSQRMPCQQLPIGRLCLRASTSLNACTH